MNTDERDATITTGGESLSIFEIMQRYRNDGSCEHVIRDALRRFSLLDGQAAGGDSTTVAQALWDAFWSDLSSDRWSVKDVERVVRPHLNDAATRMRERCVEKVRDIANDYRRLRKDNANIIAHHIEGIVSQLESPNP